jgi:hypothetical protein
MLQLHRALLRRPFSSATIRLYEQFPALQFTEDQIASCIAASPQRDLLRHFILTVDNILKQKDDRLTETERNLRERLIEKDKVLQERITETERNLRERLIEKDKVLEARIADKDELFEELRKRSVQLENRIDFIDGVLTARRAFERFEIDLRACHKVAVSERFTFGDGINTERQQRWYVAYLKLSQHGSALRAALEEIGMALHSLHNLPGDVWDKKNVSVYARDASKVYDRLSHQVHQYESDSATTLKLVEPLLKKEGMVYLRGIAKLHCLQPREVA